MNLIALLPVATTDPGTVPITVPSALNFFGFQPPAFQKKSLLGKGPTEALPKLAPVRSVSGTTLGVKVIPLSEVVNLYNSWVLPDAAQIVTELSAVEPVTVNLSPSLTTPVVL